MQTFCGFKIRSMLANGGYLATDERDKPVVLKPLDESCLLHGRLHRAIVERLHRIREIPSTSVAHFQGVIKCRDGKSEKYFLIWQHIDGESIEALAKQGAGLSAALADARRAIESVHQTGLVHGAIHERNIIRSHAGRVVLTDISPLLFHDPEVDIVAFEQMEKRLRAGRFDPKEIEDDTLKSFLRRRMIAGAAFAAFIGLSVSAWFAWHYR